MTVFRPCDACLLVDGDPSYKQVEYCRVCDAYLCDKCKWNFFKRAKAMKIRMQQNRRKL